MRNLAVLIIFIKWLFSPIFLVGFLVMFVGREFEGALILIFGFFWNGYQLFIDIANVFKGNDKFNY